MDGWMDGRDKRKDGTHAPEPSWLAHSQTCSLQQLDSTPTLWDMTSHREKRKVQFHPGLFGKQERCAIKRTGLGVYECEPDILSWNAEMFVCHAHELVTQETQQMISQRALYSTDSGTDPGTQRSARSREDCGPTLTRSCWSKYRAKGSVKGWPPRISAAGLLSAISS